VAVELLERFESLKYPEKMAGDALYFIKKNLHAPPITSFLASNTLARRQKYRRQKDL